MFICVVRLVRLVLAVLLSFPGLVMVEARHLLHLLGLWTDRLNCLACAWVLFEMMRCL